MFFRNEEVIKFKCEPELLGKIPEPYPARHYMPEWYKKLENFYFSEEGDPVVKKRVPTLKRCPPFLDALVSGWIIPLAADVEFTIRDNGAGLSWLCGENKAGTWICQHHDIKQLNTHPNAPQVPIKIINHWLIETPPGWSCLFVPPLNRVDKHLDLFSGIVETDKYYEYINFPGMLKPVEGDYLRIEQGYPLMQVIPYKRGFDKDAQVGALSEKDLKRLKDTRDTRANHPSLYRDKLWEKK